MTKRKPPSPTLNHWQQHLLADLKRLAAQHPRDIRLIGRPAVAASGQAAARISLHTADIPHTKGGLALREDEEFLFVLPPTTLMPPWVQTPHTRFAGAPHVLEGYRLCIYLDAAREWDPEGGMSPVLNRLWQWLTDAAANRFDATTALFHAVGGVLHRTPGTPTIVVREPDPCRPAGVGWLTPRSTHRLDLSDRSAGDHSLRLPVLALGHSLPLGAGGILADLLLRIDANATPHTGTPPTSPQLGLRSPAFLTALANSALRNPHGTCQYFVLAVPHPNLSAIPYFLLAGRLPAQASDALRHASRTTAPRQLSSLPADVREAALEWCYLSDERPAVTTRRDAQRPASAFYGTRVHVWGCGGIGAWAAELVARAGATHIALSDPGTVTGGLLVRQNYTENDIGSAKAIALAERLRSIRDDLTVEISDPPPSPALLDAAEQADVIIDATVSVTAGRFLDLLARFPGRKAVLAQMATDTASASHGVLTISAPDTGQGPSAIDHATGQHVLAAPDLEPYRALWIEPEPGDEIRPTRGCSIPTFHGSAADLAGITATLITLLGMQLHHPLSGTHLCAQPHTGTHPAHRFVSYTPQQATPFGQSSPTLPSPGRGGRLDQPTLSVGT
ncbi:ThiF family adenylyltransferase [Streptomyces sp. CHD11]|uniref:ThiF family adenylyltransferase n=1 Tax=Streptomyces sp. CHD11 TaxID=2741325 RepID=UPI001BFC1B4A|nr:ThiF family adenylyltransferase [Streptomyces sp. CHD11]MBT3152738.1 ThiF family adenylyltransferase [Streptomyces sp. CHD11]